MKINQKKIAEMKADIIVILKSSSFTMTKLKKIYLNNPKYFCYEIWTATCNSRRYEDSNPNCLKNKTTNKRLLERIPDYEIYPCDSEDNNLFSALKKICNDIFANLKGI